MIVNQELVKMVGSNTLFKGISKEFLKTFIRPKNYFGVKEGTIIYNRGDESTDLYLIVEGEVKIKFCDSNKVEYRFITDFFGENEILNNSERTSYAVANHDCILYSIKAEELKSLSNQQRIIETNLNKKNNNEVFDELSGTVDNSGITEAEFNDSGNGTGKSQSEVYNMDINDDLNDQNSETDEFNEDDEILN